MARYYFHLKNGELTPDHIGRDMPDMRGVKIEAIRAMRELTDLVAEPKLVPGDPWKVWVTHNPDPHSEPLFTLELSAKLG